MALTAAYLDDRGGRASATARDWAPEASRRARALPALGGAARSSGAAASPSSSSATARSRRGSRSASRASPASAILNDVVLNQVARSASATTTRRPTRVIARVQRRGDVLARRHRWQGRAAMRISVSGWRDDGGRRGPHPPTRSPARGAPSRQRLAVPRMRIEGARGARLRRRVGPRRRDRAPAARGRRARDDRRRQRRARRGARRRARRRRFAACDVTDPAAGRRGRGRRRRRRALRIAVTCAGIGWAEKTAGRRGPHAVEPFHRVIAVNLLGSFHLLRAAGAAMLANDARRRRRGRRDRDDRLDRRLRRPDRPARLLRLEGRRRRHDAAGGARPRERARIRVCTIAPGLFDTPLLAGLPEEARAALGAQVPHPARLGAARGVRRARRAHRRRTRCSTARSSGSTARCACRRADDAERLGVIR